MAVEINAMLVSIDSHWEEFIATVVAGGLYGSAREVVEEGLRLVEERDAKLKALREMVNASLSEGQWFSDEEVGEYLGAAAARLAKEGF